MNISIPSGFKTAISSAAVLTLALAGLTPAPALAAPTTYTCVATVSTAFAPAYSPGSSGAATLGTASVTGNTVGQALAVCHLKAKLMFLGNADWSDAKKFCARYALPTYELAVGDNSKTRLVWLTDYLAQIGSSNGVYRIGGYSVVCNAPNPNSFQQVPQNPTVVPTQL